MKYFINITTPEELMNVNAYNVLVPLSVTHLLVSLSTRIGYVCVAGFEDGRMGLAVAAKNKLFSLLELMQDIDGAKRVTWYVSDMAGYLWYTPCLCVA